MMDYEDSQGPTKHLRGVFNESLERQLAQAKAVIEQQKEVIEEYWRVNRKQDDASHEQSALIETLAEALTKINSNPCYASGVGCWSKEALQQYEQWRAK